MPPAFAIGDIHGHPDVFINLLRHAGLIDSSHAWAGADATLIMPGDYVDRGPDGVAVLDLVMRLQTQAAQMGGQLIALLGNHDFMLALAHQFPRGVFMESWLKNGGNPDDRKRLTDDHVRWILNLPSMARFADKLIIHADGEFYYDYGHSVRAVNDEISRIVKGANWEELDYFAGGFSEHRAFAQKPKKAARFLSTYGGQQILHGHTPISKMIIEVPQLVRAPHIYADGLCVNLDGGIYLGGPGFVHLVNA
jgi:hypothetical protein